MQNTWYPGKRLAPPGTLPIIVALSQIFPTLTFTLVSYTSIVGDNVCEMSTVGSLLPILTFCLVSPQRVLADKPLRNKLIVLMAALTLITLWQLAPMPHWIGHLLLWDLGNPQRLLFVSGFLLTVSCLLIWRAKCLSTNPIRIVVFLVAGPALALGLKVGIFHLKMSIIPFDESLCLLILVAGVHACLSPAATRLATLLGAIALMNIVVFGRFNPLQPAAPIFDVPDTHVVSAIRREEAITPGHFVLDTNFPGATLNGIGIPIRHPFTGFAQPRSFSKILSHHGCRAVRLHLQSLGLYPVDERPVADSVSDVVDQRAHSSFRTSAQQTHLEARGPLASRLLRPARRRNRARERARKSAHHRRVGAMERRRCRTGTSRDQRPITSRRTSGYPQAAGYLGIEVGLFLYAVRVPASANEHRWSPDQAGGDCDGGTPDFARADSTSRVRMPLIYCQAPPRAVRRRYWPRPALPCKPHLRR